MGHGLRVPTCVAGLACYPTDRPTTTPSLSTLRLRMSALKTIAINPSVGVPTASVIFAHGLGDTSAGWVDVCQMLSQRPSLKHIRFVLPTAPVQPVSLNFGMKMTSWFDIRHLEDKEGQADEAGMLQSAESIKALAAAEEAGTGVDMPTGTRVARDRIVYGGFSQGAVLSYLAGLSSVGVEKRPVAGLVALSGWLPMRHKVASWFKDSSEPPVFPVFHGHGDADPIVKYSFGARSTELLKEGLGFGPFRQITDGPHKGKYTGVDFRTYPSMAHSACLEEVEALAQWLEKVVPAV